MFLSGNTAFYDAFVKFGGMMLAVMGLIVLVTFLTPKIAKLFDKNKNEPSPERVDRTFFPENYTVKGPYDKQKLEGFDSNYKIYNTDIYGSEALERLTGRQERNVNNGKE